MLLILFNLLPSLESLFQSSLSAGLCHEILLQSSVPQRNPLPQVWLILQPPSGEHTSMHCIWIRISSGGSGDKVREDHSGNLMSLLSWGGHLGWGDHDEWVELKSVGKGRFMHAVFWPTLGHIKMDLGPELFPYQEKRAHMACAGLLPMWEHLSLFQAQCMPLCLAEACATYATWSPLVLYLSSMGRVQSPCTAVWKGFRKANSCLRGLLTMGDWCPLSRLIMLSLFHVNKELFHPVLGWVVFLGDISTNTQWEEVFELLFLAVGTWWFWSSCSWNPPPENANKAFCSKRWFRISQGRSASVRLFPCP